MSITSIAHVCISSPDLEATLKFYCGALGLQKQLEFTRKGRVIGFMLKAANNTFVEVFESSGVGEQSPASKIKHFCLETDSIEELHRTLTEAGYAPRPIKLGSDKSLQFWMQDPNGIEFEFRQDTPESIRLAHSSVEVSW